MVFAYNSKFVYNPNYKNLLASIVLVKVTTKM